MDLKGWTKCCVSETQAREFQIARLRQIKKGMRPEVWDKGSASLEQVIKMCAGNARETKSERLGDAILQSSMETTAKSQER